MTTSAALMREEEGEMETQELEKLTEEQLFEKSIEEREVESQLTPLEIRVNATKVNVSDLLQRKRELENDSKMAINAVLQKKAQNKSTHERSQAEMEAIYQKEQTTLDEHLTALGYDPKPEWVPTPHVEIAAAAVELQKRRGRKPGWKKPEAVVAPDLVAPKKRGRPAKAATAEPRKTRKKHKYSAAEKAAISIRIKAMWAKRRKDKAKSEKGK